MQPPVVIDVAGRDCKAVFAITTVGRVLAADPSLVRAVTLSEISPPRVDSVWTVLRARLVCPCWIGARSYLMSPNKPSASLFSYRAHHDHKRRSSQALKYMGTQHYLQ